MARQVYGDITEDDYHRIFGPSQTMIISTGDISDVDGFLALAEYAKTGASCLFVMNYPTFLDPSMKENTPETRNEEGLGFDFGVNTVVPIKNASDDYFLWYVRRYKRSLLKPKENMKQSYTDIAFQICKRVWSETLCQSAKGSLYFYIGGINTVNPFACNIVKKEAEHWFSYVDPLTFQLSTKEGSLFDLDGNDCDLSVVLNSFNSIFMDFNGSAAFFNGEFESKLAGHESKFTSLFVMGGVLSNEVPKTMVGHDKLNRFSGSTMNQLYHPEGTKRLLDFAQRLNMTIFILSNNAVPFMASTAVILQYLQGMNILSSICEDLVRNYYRDYDINPPKKLFDLHLASLITSQMNGVHVPVQNMNLYLIDKYGFSLISSQSGVAAALTEYFDNLGTKIQPSSEAMYKAERDTIQKAMTAGHYSEYNVNNVFIEWNHATSTVNVLGCPWYALDRLTDLVIRLQ